jgi:hypothetical protein
MYTYAYIYNYKGSLEKVIQSYGEL